MTKYLVFKNQPDSGQANVPGSREEMACFVAQVVSQEANPKDFYVAYSSGSPSSTWESLKETAKFSVEIDDERAELWEKEILPLTDLSEAIDDAIGEAYSAIVEAARTLDHACEKSENFQDIKVLRNIGMDRAFDNLEHNSFEEISEKVEEIFEVEMFSHHHA